MSSQAGAAQTNAGGTLGQAGLNASAAGGSTGGGSPGGGSAGGAGGNLSAAGSNAGGQNQAVGRCYAPACTAFWDSDPCNAFDGDLSTATGSGKTWDSSLGTLAVDFGAPQTITKVVVHYADNADPNPGYTIDISDDGQVWTTIRDVETPGTVDTQVGLNASSRYIRLYCKHFFFDPWWMHSIREIELVRE